MGSRQIIEKSLYMLRSLPRISLNNIRDNPGSKQSSKRGRGQHGGDKHGAGNKGSGQRQNYMRLGYETGNNPFYLRVPQESYYRGHQCLLHVGDQCRSRPRCSYCAQMKNECDSSDDSFTCIFCSGSHKATDIRCPEHGSLRRQYPPLTLLELQHIVDKTRVDITKPIDIACLVKSGLYSFNPEQKHFGVNLTDEGADIFAAQLNIEVQWASEQVIAAIERNGGVITTAYYDPHSLFLLKNPKKFFETGQAIPRRMIPPPDAIEYYSSAENRGYLADPEQISEARLKLAQKYGYELPNLENNPNYNMLCERKDPRQIFYGLEPGWVVNLKEQSILKPKDEALLSFYSM